MYQKTSKSKDLKLSKRKRKSRCRKDARAEMENEIVENRNEIDVKSDSDYLDGDGMIEDTWERGSAEFQQDDVSVVQRIWK